MQLFKGLSNTWEATEWLFATLQEICLHTKLIAPIQCPIAEFLAKAPDPPPYMVTRNAVMLLKVSYNRPHAGH